MDLFIKLFMLVIFFGVMIGIGLYCRRHATDVNGFVLGGRNVGPWLTAFAYVADPQFIPEDFITLRGEKRGIPRIAGKHYLAIIQLPEHVIIEKYIP